MAGKQYAKAEERFASAIKLTPNDYAANVLMAKCLSVQDKNSQAIEYARSATKIYPQEAQAQKMLGVLSLSQGNPSAAYEALDRYDRLLPGDAGVTFLKGVSLEGMGKQKEAANQYAAYLRQNKRGKAAEYSQSRLQSWGYLK
jgi:tetratricopeptide (TPR) repeat protein